MKVTLSAIKADVGSIGGHTKPTDKMIETVKKRVNDAIQSGLLLDGMVTHTGDDIAIIMSHTHGKDNTKVHQFAWDSFIAATKKADECGCYGAGQDLLVDAPSSNVRGAGPGVAEIEFEFNQKEPRLAESFMVVASDKTGPGAYNLPFFLSFADPMYCAGLMLPKMAKGFSFEIIDMNNTDGESSLTLNTPEDYYKLTILLRDNERFGIKAIYSREYAVQALSSSTDRLHNIAGKYTGKDDPIAIIRNQGIFPAPEEILSPFVKAHYVGGDARGSHNMPLMPVPINTAVTGAYCLPIVSAIGFSLAKSGTFTQYGYVDFFDNPAWDLVRLRAQEKAIEMRSQGWSGPAMLPYTELEYSGFKKSVTDLVKQFKVKKR